MGVLQAIPVAANARLLVRNLFALARSTDPIAIAERVGITVSWGTPLQCLHAPAVLLPGAILVNTETDATVMRHVVADMLGLALIDIYAIDTEAPFAFARELADLLCVFENCRVVANAV